MNEKATDQGRIAMKEEEKRATRYL